jgi:BirA family biotin operon repressor/biotin-[acetyl-CoA-carboxylase] ligase
MSLLRKLNKSSSVSVLHIIKYPAMIIGSSIIYYPEVDSTNTLAMGMLKTGKLPEGAVIHAGYQTGGRGQPGNNWESEEGKNLLISLILYPEFIKPAEQFLISMAISLGICDFLREYFSNCMIKWPNDIYAADEKIAGILIENAISGEKIINTVAGIGLNINQTYFKSGPPSPVSLKMLTGREYDIKACLNRLLSNLDKRYKKLISGKHSDIRKDYTASLYRYMEWHSFFGKGQPFTGRITSVSVSGLLQIEDRKGNINEFAFREIEFADKGYSNR